MSEQTDYRQSHTAPEKGASYDESFSSKSYRKHTWQWEQRTLLRAIDRHCAQPREITYLDFACGTGRILSFLESRVASSSGVDVSDSMLEVASKNVHTSDLFKADLKRSNIFEGRQFSLITAFRFFSNAQPSLRQEIVILLASMLSESGCLIFNIHRNKHSSLAKMSYWYHRIKDGQGSLEGVSLQEMAMLLDGAGLKIVQVYSWGLLPIRRDDTRVPAWLYLAINGLGSRFSALTRKFAQNLVCVCKHKAST